MTSHIDSDTGTDTGMPNVTLQTLAAAGDQPGWRVLDTARTQQFTGEITFQTQPSISVYFDGGMAYHAVRAGDPSLCASLVEAGVVEPAQVARGVIRVGNVENLGRLFDRDASIDRDAVMVVLELATDDVVTAIANTVSGPFILTAYRHHVSGVHRWFVSPGGSGEQPAQLTPVGEVAQIDGSVTGDLPGLAAVLVDDDVHIEWDQPIEKEPDAAPSLHTIDDDLLSRLIGDTDQPAAMDTPTVAPASIADPAPFTDLAPPADSGIAPAQPAAESDNDPAEPAQDWPAADTVVNDDFQILWPDGSEQHLGDHDNDTDTDIPTTDGSADEIVGTDDGAADSPVTAEPEAEEAPSSLSFTMPSLALTVDNVPDEQQPEEVVDAVRRALQAIETASAGSAQLPSVAVGPLPAFQPTNSLQFDVVDPLAHEASAETIATSSTTADPGVFALESVLPFDEALAADQASDAASDAAAEMAADTTASAALGGLGGFAPPTANDSAEAVYARAAALVEQPLAGSAPAVASVVFVDAAPDEANDRSNALKRLIGSLRRK